MNRRGWDFSWETTLRTTGPVVDGTLRGDLLVVGSGDPSLGGRGGDDLTTWIAALKSAGVRPVDDEPEPTEEASASAAERDLVSALEEELRQQQNRMVFVEPRVDVQTQTPRENAPLSDASRRALTPVTPPQAKTPEPFAQGNTRERVEAENIERQRGDRLAGLDHLGAEREVRDEDAVHHVDVDEVRAPAFDGGDRLAERRTNGRVPPGLDGDEIDERTDNTCDARQLLRARPRARCRVSRHE